MDSFQLDMRALIRAVNFSKMTIHESARKEMKYGLTKLILLDDIISDGIRERVQCF